MNKTVYSTWLLVLTVLFASCTSNSGTKKSSAPPPPPAQDIPPPPAPVEKKVDSRFTAFELEEGECPENDMIYTELGNGVAREVALVSAYALPYMEITSSKGDVVRTREGNGYTLYIADYEIDRNALGKNPEPDQTKLEFTLISQDKTAIRPALYKTRHKGNFAVGPNMFANDKAYPMKDNFVGGVKLTKVSEEEVCGEIRLKSKFEVVIICPFRAKLLD